MYVPQHFTVYCKCSVTLTTEMAEFSFLTIQINQFLLLRQITFNFIVIIIEILLLLQ